MSDQTTRADRARNGSRRQRDRDALRREERDLPLLPRDTRLTDESLEAWAKAFAQLDSLMPETTIVAWFGELELAGEYENALCLQGPRHIAQWARWRCGELIGNTIRELTDYRGAFIGQAPELEEIENERGGLL